MIAGQAELADALDSKSGACLGHVDSSHTSDIEEGLTVERGGPDGICHRCTRERSMRGDDNIQPIPHSQGV